MTDHRDDRSNPDAELVSAALRGDADAFTLLFHRHAGAVRTTARCHVRDHHRVHDVCQETFLRAYTRLSTLREPARFRPWLLQVARHVAIDEQRRRARTRTEPLDEDAASCPDEPATIVELDELRDELTRGLAKLSPRDASALRLAGRGAAPAQIATALGVTPGAAKVVVHRARRRLRDVVELGDDPSVRSARAARRRTVA